MDIVCLRNISINTLHKGDDDDDDNDNDDNDDDNDGGGDDDDDNNNNTNNNNNSPSPRESIAPAVFFSRHVPLLRGGCACRLAVPIFVTTGTQNSRSIKP